MPFDISIITPEVQGEAPLALLEGTFDQRLSKAASYGYHGVELVTCDPTALDSAEIAGQLSQHGLKAAAVATGYIAASRGLTLAAEDSGVRRQALRLLEELIRFCAAVGSKVVTIGSFRGKAAPIGGLEAAERQLHEAISTVDALASELNVTLALEPINKGESDFLTDARETCQFIDAGGYQSVGLLLDSYHVFLGEPKPLDAFRIYRDRLVHVHLADSERKAVGSGTIDFKGMEQVLEEIGYQGWQGVELARADAPDKNGLSSMEFLRSLLDQ